MCVCAAVDDGLAPGLYLHRTAGAKAGRYHTDLGASLPQGFTPILAVYLADKVLAAWLHSAGLCLIHPAHQNLSSVHVYVCMCMCACMHASVRACVRACVRA